MFIDLLLTEIEPKSRNIQHALSYIARTLWLSGSWCIWVSRTLSAYVKRKEYTYAKYHQIDVVWVKNILLFGIKIPVTTVNIKTIHWKGCLGKWRQYFKSNATAPLRIPASIKKATNGTYKSTGIIKKSMEYGKG